MLLRSYRVGHGWLWDRWSQALNDRIGDPQELVAAQEKSSAFMFAYIDRISDVLVEKYGTERERMVRGAMQLRAETVRALLAGEAIDEEIAASRLGYELRRHHVALRVSCSASEVRGLERAAGEAAAALGPGEPLVVPCGLASLDVWWGAYQPVPTDALERYKPPAGVRVAFGALGHGVAGFRHSHAEAVQAARVATLAGDGAQAVTGYGGVELVSLLARDLQRARRFVSSQLGPLASTAEPAARLRETVLAYLVAGGSGTRVAKQLYVHQNTVAYRVKRAEELLRAPGQREPGRADMCAYPGRRPRAGRPGGRRRQRRGQPLKDLGQHDADHPDVPGHDHGQKRESGPVVPVLIRRGLGRTIRGAVLGHCVTSGLGGERMPRQRTAAAAPLR